MSQYPIFCIEGNIGSGKSTVLRGLQSLGYICGQEPVDEWQSIKDDQGVDLLTNFYKDTARYAILFQQVVLASRLHQIDSCQTQVIERSPMSCVHIFARLLQQDGVLNTLDMNALQYIYDRQNRTRELKYIYIRTDPDTCMHRIAARARGAEVGISHEYIAKLYNRYESVMQDCNAVIIDGSGTPDQVLQQVIQYIKGE